MNRPRLRVLGNRHSKRSWLHPILDKLAPSIEPRDIEAQTIDCDGLLVFDDCNGGESIQAALAMRRTRPDLKIAVVKLIDRDWSEAECLTRFLSETEAGDHGGKTIPENRLSTLMGLGRASLDVQIDEDAIKFEYQG